MVCSGRGAGPKVERSTETDVDPELLREAVQAGEGRCPVLWSGSHNCSVQLPLPKWCLVPMQVCTYLNISKTYIHTLQSTGHTLHL